MVMETIGEFEYSKKDLIGHGAFAVVFKGRYKKKPTDTVAIKCITKKNLAKSQNLLSKEIKILKELSGLQHENVVALLDCKETSHHVYLIMEYCNGGDLADYLQAKGTLSEDTISSFLRQIAGSMKALNGMGIVHRDLKPQNILLCHPSKKDPAPGITLKIADFGFARFLQDGVMAATLCGSPMYMAPEVIMSIQYDAKADLWSVGTIVYQCLTGKAPFQAQTPQQLKMFYERNANLCPNIPSGTSPELRDLLLQLLKRNAKDRIEFVDFFKHPFLYPQVKSSPVPVPPRRRSSRSSVSESPPVKAVSASPLSGHAFSSPPPLPPRTCGKLPPAMPAVQEPMDVGSSHEFAASAARSHSQKDLSHKSGSTTEYSAGTDVVESTRRLPTPVEDFVMVPENLPEDHSATSYGSAGRPSVNLNAIFSKSPEARFTGHSVAPASVPSTIKSPVVSERPQQTSPSRPSTLPVAHTQGSTEPIPVPSQVKAYEMIKRSTATSPSSPMVDKPHSLESPKPESGITIPRKPSSGSLPSVGSISPPSVQFSIGTPPTTTWKRNSPGAVAMVMAGSSPHRRTALQRISTTPGAIAVPSSNPLPTILGSPTKVPSTLEFLTAADDKESPNSPLVPPFGNFFGHRAKTCPDNLTAGGYCPDGSPSGFSIAKQVAQSPPGKIIVPYNSSNPSIRRVDSYTRDVPKSPRHGAEDTSYSARRYSSCCDDSPNHSLPFAQSPQNMEGPVMFVAPELAEETLMDKQHNDTVAKLNYILALVECIIELAQSRSSPLSESITEAEPDTTEGLSMFTLDTMSFLSESQRRMEQLVLYIRALQLLSSSIDLATCEVKQGRLQPSNNVNTVVREMTGYYHQCLGVCHNLHCQGISLNTDTHPQAAAITADKLIYSYAIDMCQTAAVDELFGDPQECFQRYRNAHILLHSLGQHAVTETDRQLLNKYRLVVEKRLYILQNQHVVYPLDNQ